jgi:hypothetical protein
MSDKKQVAKSSCPKCEDNGGQRMVMTLSFPSRIKWIKCDCRTSKKGVKNA